MFSFFGAKTGKAPAKIETLDPPIESSGSGMFSFLDSKTVKAPKKVKTSDPTSPSSSVAFTSSSPDKESFTETERKDSQLSGTSKFAKYNDTDAAIINFNDTFKDMEMNDVELQMKQRKMRWMKINENENMNKGSRTFFGLEYPRAVSDLTKKKDQSSGTPKSPGSMNWLQQRNKLDANNQDNKNGTNNLGGFADIFQKKNPFISRSPTKIEEKKDGDDAAN
jgi:hypothetical protein